jgi:tyrosyl-tRNA synthetase
MWPYFDLVSDRTPEEIAALSAKVKAGLAHPMDVKMSLAREIISGFHGAERGEKAAAEFQRIFRDREAPKEIKEINFKRTEGGLVAVYVRNGESTTHIISGKDRWSQVLANIGEIASISEAERVIKHGGLEINGKVVTDPTTKLDTERAAKYDLRIGKKKFLRVIVE